MNTTFEALLRGYILFRVNGKYFGRYNSALAKRKNITGNISFEGFNIFYFMCFMHAWRGFYYRVVCDNKRIEPTQK